MPFDDEISTVLKFLVSSRWRPPGWLFISRVAFMGPFDKGLVFTTPFGTIDLREERVWYYSLISFVAHFISF